MPILSFPRSSVGTTIAGGLNSNNFDSIRYPLVFSLTEYVKRFSSLIPLIAIQEKYLGPLHPKLDGIIERQHVSVYSETSKRPCRYMSSIIIRQV